MLLVFFTDEEREARKERKSSDSEPSRRKRSIEESDQIKVGIHA